MGKRGAYSFIVLLLVFVILSVQILIPSVRATTSNTHEPDLVANRINDIQHQATSLPTGLKNINEKEVLTTENEASPSTPMFSDVVEDLPVNLELSFSTPPIVNQETDISVTVVSEVDIAETNVRLLLPNEFSSAAILNWTGDLQKGVAENLVCSVIVSKTGNYRIEVVATSNSLGSLTAVSSESLFVSVTEAAETGTVYSSSDAPFSPNMLDAVQTSNSTIMGSVGSPGTLTVSGYWYYYDQNYVQKPARYARVELWDGELLFDVKLATTYVQSNGYYQFPAIENDDGLLESGYDIYVKVFCDSDLEVYVTDSLGGTYYSETSKIDNVPDGNYNMGSYTITGDYRGCFGIYDSVIDEFMWLYNEVSWYRSEVQVRWPCEDWPHSHGDRIDLPSSSYYPNVEWNANNVIYHEYAHCIHYETRGGSFPPLTGPDPHYIDSESSVGFALTEGWAEFMQCAVANDPYGASGSLETTLYADGPYGHGDAGDWDGNIVEGAVASVFWDMFDGTYSEDYPYYSQCQIGDYVNNEFSKLWDIFLNDKPNSVDTIWDNWSPKDTDLWAIFYNSRINKDGTAPSAPVISSSTHPDQNTVYVDNNPSFSWTTPTDLSGIAGYSCTLDQLSSTTPDTTIDQTGNSKSYTEIAIGDWYFHVRAQDNAGYWGPASHYRIRVGAGFDFSVSASPSSQTVIVEDLTTYSVAAELLNGTTQSVSLSCSPSIAGVTYSFNPSSENPTFSSTLTVQTSSNTPPATYTLTITGNGGGQVHSTTVQLIVISQPGTIEGTITDSLGNGIANCNIAYTGTSSGQTSSDSSGFYSIPNLPPGSYQVTASRNGFDPQTKQATVNPGSTTTFDFQLLDSTPPSMPNPDDGVSGWSSNNQPTFTWSASTDDGTGVAGYYWRVDNELETWTILTSVALPTQSDGLHTFYVKAKDNAGNNGTYSYHQFQIDVTLPSGSISLNQGAEYTTSTTVNLALTYSDTTSGVDQIRFSNDGVWDTEQWENPSSSKTWLLTSDDGHKTVYYQVKDQAGLISPTYSDSITLDTVAPTGSITIAGGATYTTTSTVTLTLTTSDATSGVHQMRISNDGVFDTEQWETDAASKAWTLSTGDGTKTVYVQFEDQAGLISEIYEANITLDSTQPSTPNPNDGISGWNNKNTPTFTWSSSDAGSGVAGYYWRIDNGPEIWTTQTTVTLPPQSDGDHTFSIKAVDNAGNNGTSGSDTFQIDVTPPSVTISSPSSGETVKSSSITLAWSGSDASSGIEKYEIKLDSGNWIDKGTATSHTFNGMNDGSHTICVKAIDKIGNSKEYTTSFSVNVPQPTPSPSPSPTASPSPSPIPSPSPSPSPTPPLSPSPSPTQSPKPIIEPETLWLILAFVLAAAAATTIGLLIGKRKKNEKH
jgi:hypothetical protein